MGDQSHPLSVLRRAARDPQWPLRALRWRAVDRALGVNRRWYARRRGGGVDMMDADWDLLVILDACHPGLLAEAVPDGFGSGTSVGTRHSRGTDSSDFLTRQFAGRRFHDTVYVTANPYLSVLPEGTFHDTDNVLADGFDRDAGTVPPDEMVDRTLDALERYPRKRIVAHFMQPHFPFLGETGDRIDHGGIELGTPVETDAPNPWLGVMYGRLNPERVVEAYRENHRVVAPHVETLLGEVPGRAVVTADHANLLGQRTRPVPIRTYGHPSGIAHPGLTRVPWVEVPATGDRRDVCPDPPVGRRVDDADIGEKLAALGYR